MRVCFFRVVFHEKAAPYDHVAERPRPDDEVPLRHLALVSGGKEQVLAALSLVRSDDTDIGNPAVPHVIYQAEHLRRYVDDQRTVMQVDPEPGVWSVVVGSQLDRTGVHHLFPDRDGLVYWTHLQNCGTIRRLIHRRKGQQIGLHGALEVQVVEEFLDAGLVWEPIEEVQRPDGRLDPVGRLDSWRNGGAVLVLCSGGGVGKSIDGQQNTQCGTKQQPGTWLHRTSLLSRYLEYK